MPELDIDMFDSEPSVGEHVKVMGKIKSVNTDTGMVEVSYDSVSIVSKHPAKKNKYNDKFVETMPPDENGMNMTNSQSLDQALSKAFPNTQ